MERGGFWPGRSGKPGPRTGDDMVTWHARAPAAALAMELAVHTARTANMVATG